MKSIIIAVSEPAPGEFVYDIVIDGVPLMRLPEPQYDCLIDLLQGTREAAHEESTFKDAPVSIKIVTGRPA